MWPLWFAAAVLGLAAAAFAMAAVGRSRWAVSTAALLRRLEAARLSPAVSHYDARELEGLPAPVQRYFQAALKDGQPIIAAASVEHSGTFNLSPTGERWKPFTSQQRVVTCRPGFVWNGHVALVPGVEVHVHDAYLSGEGLLEPAVLGLFSLGRLQGKGEIARGELMRFLAESAWYPTALLPSQGVLWEAVDEHHAQATLVDGGIGITMRFSFDQAGLIESVRAEARGAVVGTTTVMMPWEGRWSDYRECSGMQLPFSGEAAWLTPHGRRPYWRGTISSFACEFATPPAMPRIEQCRTEPS